MAAGGASTAPLSSEESQTTFSLEDKEYYWWRCEEMSCPTRGAEPAYIPLLKVHLKVLHDKTKAELLKLLPRFRKDAQKTYLQRFELIFDDNTINLTSLNIKSLQISLLFTQILIALGKIKDTTFSQYRANEDVETLYNAVMRDPNLYSFEGMRRWLENNRNYWSALHISSEKTGPVCCPDLKYKIICVLLGELTVEEIVRTFVKQVYLCGVVMEQTYADGFFLSPLEFLHHDIIHVRNMYSGSSPMEQKTYDKLQEFINYLDSQPDLPERKACWLMLFILIHETGEGYKFSREPLKEIYGVGERDNPFWSLKRWLNPNDFGGLLLWYVGEEVHKTLTTEESIFPVLVEAGQKLVNTWNTFFQGGGAAGGAAQEPPPATKEEPPANASSRRTFENRLAGNAAAWNANVVQRRTQKDARIAEEKRLEAIEKQRKEAEAKARRDAETKADEEEVTRIFGVTKVEKVGEWRATSYIGSEVIGYLKDGGYAFGTLKGGPDNREDFYLVDDSGKVLELSSADEDPTLYVIVAEGGGRRKRASRRRKQKKQRKTKRTKKATRRS